MDINLLRSVIGVLALLCFVCITLWAYSRNAKRGFDEAARLPFTEDDDLPDARGGRPNQLG